MTTLAIDLDRLPPEAREALRGVLGGVLQQLEAPAPSPAPAAPLPLYLSVPRFAQHTGFSESKIREWLRCGLPHTNAPGQVRVIVKEALAWIQAGPGARQGLRVVAGGRP